MEAVYSEKNPGFRMNTRMEGNLSVIPHESYPETFGDGSLMVDGSLYCDFFYAATPDSNIVFKDPLLQSHQYQPPPLPDATQTLLYPDAELAGRLVMVNAEGQRIDLNPLQQRGDTMVYDGMKQTTTRVPIGLPGQVYTVDPSGAFGSAVAWRSPRYPAHDVPGNQPTSVAVRYAALSLSSDTAFSSSVMFDTVDRIDSDAFTGPTILHNGVYEARCVLHISGNSEVTAAMQISAQTVSLVDNGTVCLQGIFVVTDAPQDVQISVTGTGTEQGEILSSSTLYITKLTTEYVSEAGSQDQSLVAPATGTYRVSGTVINLDDADLSVTLLLNNQPVPDSLTVGRKCIPIENTLNLQVGDTVASDTIGGNTNTDQCTLSIIRVLESETGQGTVQLGPNAFHDIGQVTVSSGGTYRVTVLATLTNTDNSEDTYALRIIADRDDELQYSLFYAQIHPDGSRTVRGFALAFLPPNTNLTLQGVSMQGSAATCAGRLFFDKLEATISPIRGLPDFGRFYSYVTENVKSFSTTSRTFRDYLQLTTGDIPTGIYGIQATVDWKMSRPGTSMALQMTIASNSEVIDEYTATPLTAIDEQRATLSGQRVNLPQGNSTVIISVRTSGTAITLTRGTIEIFMIERT